MPKKMIKSVKELENNNNPYAPQMRKSFDRIKGILVDLEALEKKPSAT